MNVNRQQAERLSRTPWTQPLSDEERRTGPRRAVEGDVWLLDLEGLTVLRCHTDNLSPGGFWATVPLGSGLAVGQRYEIRIRANDPASARLAAIPPSCFGTVVRLQTLSDSETHPLQLGFAIRFDAAGGQ